MGLVNYEIFPGNAAQAAFLLKDSLVRAHKRVELIPARGRVWPEELLAGPRALLLGTPHPHSTDGRTPLPELPDPVAHNRFGNYDNVGSLDSAGLPEIREETDGLQGLPQSFDQFKVITALQKNSSDRHHGKKSS